MNLVQKSVNCAINEFCFMEREIYKDLLKWKSKRGHKPLLLQGAPMVGKTYIAKEFGKHEYTHYVRFSFLEQPVLKNIFRNQPEVTKVIRLLSSLFRRDIVPGETLLILDDIHLCPDAVELLRDFSEDAPNLDLIAIACFSEADAGYSLIPFDALDHLTLHPMNFDEFLLAQGRTNLAPKLLDALKHYAFCGGMPAVVQAYLENPELGPMAIRQMQLDLLQSLESRLTPRQAEVWNAVHQRMCKDNHKFFYSDIKKAARVKDFKPAVTQLIQKGLLFCTHRVDAVSQPLDYYKDEDSFVLYPLDVGLLAAKLAVEPQEILVSGSALALHGQALARQIASQTLRTNSFPVYHFARTGSLVTMDFIIQTGSRIVAVEVNARPAGNDKALKLFSAAHPGRRSVRLSLEEQSALSWMENFPLYSFGEFLSSL